jgi:hypothetical protein
MPEPVRRAPVVLDAIGAEDDALLYVDGARFREELLRDLLGAFSALRADVQVELKSAQAECGFQPMLAIDELFVGLRWKGAGGDAMGGAVARMQHPVKETERCLRALVPDASQATLDGRPAWQLRTLFVTSSDGLMVIASSAAEARSIIQRLQRPLPEAMRARAALSGAIVAGLLGEPNPFGIASASLRWEARNLGSRLQLRARFMEEMSARQVQAVLTETLEQAQSSSASLEPTLLGVIGKLVRGTIVTRAGPSLAVDIDAPPLSGQAGVVGRMMGIAVREVRRHIAYARMGEARQSVFEIARALADYVARAPRRPVRFPASAPLVPSDIPYGKPVVVNSSSFSHPSWQAIGFSFEGPAYYAYDFVTADDGKSVVARARGDIDGDGTTSLFELDVRLDARGVAIIAPIIRERDPDE